MRAERDWSLDTRCVTAGTPAGLAVEFHPPVDVRPLRVLLPSRGDCAEWLVAVRADRLVEFVHRRRDSVNSIGVFPDRRPTGYETVAVVYGRLSCRLVLDASTGELEGPIDGEGRLHIQILR